MPFRLRHAAFATLIFSIIRCTRPFFVATRASCRARPAMRDRADAMSMRCQAAERCAATRYRRDVFCPSLCRSLLTRLERLSAKAAMRVRLVLILRGGLPRMMPAVSRLMPPMQRRAADAQPRVAHVAFCHAAARKIHRVEVCFFFFEMPLMLMLLFCPLPPDTTNPPATRQRCLMQAVDVLLHGAMPSVLPPCCLPTDMRQRYSRERCLRQRRAAARQAASNAINAMPCR